MKEITKLHNLLSKKKIPHKIEWRENGKCHFLMLSEEYEFTTSGIIRKTIKKAKEANESSDKTNVYS